uniref:DUF834 domain-containing protein n=1 Tax=Setaria viridis TaxID=4556 RepID=A0A4U6V3A1_SETVI|nr:hypothetical protein SEVIR_4G147002v2 [Setaria viridis]
MTGLGTSSCSVQAPTGAGAVRCGRELGQRQRNSWSSAQLGGWGCGGGLAAAAVGRVDNGEGGAAAVLGPQKSSSREEKVKDA